MDIPEFFHNVFTWLGTPAQVVSATVLTTYLALWIRRELGLKSLAVKAESVRVEGQKVEAADEADIRDHWAKEVEQLRDALDKQSERHNSALTALEERHGRAMLYMEERQTKCEQERDRLSSRLTEAEQKLSGALKQISLQSADNLMILDAVGSPDVQPAALEAARRIVERHRLESGGEEA